MKISIISFKELTRNLTKHRASTTNANSSKVFYRNEIGENVLIIGKKEFHYVENQGMIKDNWVSFQLSPSFCFSFFYDNRTPLTV